jgi:cyclic beta-1,2-glucan synthetase
MNKLERFKGHFYNWYYTQNLKPMARKYISSVDSGNLTAYLVILKTFLRDQKISPIFSKNLLKGLQDTIICA